MHLPSSCFAWILSLRIPVVSLLDVLGLDIHKGAVLYWGPNKGP